MTFYKQVRPILMAIEKEIGSHLEARTPLAEEVSRYILKSGGKKLRPLLFVLSSHLCGCENGEEIRLAPIFEYLHVATLLHDDVIDEAHLRRGKPTANNVWGNTIPILAGDFLLARALELAASSGLLKMVQLLAQTTSWLAQGEILEIVKTDALDLSEKEYFEIINGKTAVLIAASSRLGAVLAGAEEDKENALQKYGHRLGLAFQIIDDVLDYIGSEKEFGKPVGHDIKEGKVTLPLIYALKACTLEEKKQVKKQFERRKEEDIAAIVTLVKAKKGLELATNKAIEFVKEAKEALSIFPPHPAKEILLQIADFVIKRRY
ncbi:MAG: polyprenyl synthetase family protein [Candidatus Desulfofervidaceae bacterium]|nr:polyprenyl synthetase family protein [Candidatus Desulfofervidaceae bacterium]MDL1970216.1 polyprenyl synthetase family protein [Candidatus Desulfofervidaceae bacterium]